MKTRCLLVILFTVIGCYAGTPDQKLLDAATAEKPALIKTLERLVNIETGSDDAKGMAEMNSLLVKELESLGFTVAHHTTTGVSSGRVSVGDNIVGVLHGNGSKKIMLQAHQDTVYSRGTLALAPFRIQGDLAYGPGIADDKGGIVVILHSLKLLKAQNFNEFGTITVVFNTDEEQSSVGSKALIIEKAKQQDYILSFEPTLIDPEGLTYGTSGIGSVTVSINGLAAHAGQAPEEGVNALVEASDFVLRTMDLDEGSGGLRFNWTMGKAGEARNIIPANASLLADIRFPTDEKLELLTTELNQRAASKKLPNSKIEVVVEAARPAFTANEKDKLLVDKAISIYKSIGYPMLVVDRIGGGSDAAFAALSGNPVIEGLGLPGYGYHTTKDEYVNLEAIPRRLYLTSKLVIDLSQNK